MTPTTVCVVGGGPAGMMLGLLLARANVRVVVVEKHADFLRDFRGDTVHPSTLELLDELGIGERFAALPHSRMTKIKFPAGDDTFVFGDLSRLKIKYPYIAMVPQWDFLDMLADVAQREATFDLWMNTECIDLLWHNGAVAGIRYRGQDGKTGELRATLTVAADGRWSTVRQASGLCPKEFTVPFDAWWFRLDKPAHETNRNALTSVMRDRQFVGIIPRPDSVQVAYLARKGTDTQLRAAGVSAFRERLRTLFPQAGAQIDKLKSMDDVKFLDVRLNRLPVWHRDGVLCIGDAAHAMSPIGGVGINLAVQDAVAAATLLAQPLKEGTLNNRTLAHVQTRRRLPTVVTQLLQRLLHAAVIEPVMAGKRDIPPVPLTQLLRRVPALSAIPAYLVGVGLRPEHTPHWARRQPQSSPRPKNHGTSPNSQDYMSRE